MEAAYVADKFFKDGKISGYDLARHGTAPSRHVPNWLVPAIATGVAAEYNSLLS
jgi:hypothetical protein